MTPRVKRRSTESLACPFRLQHCRLVHSSKLSSLSKWAPLFSIPNLVNVIFVPVGTTQHHRRYPLYPASVTRLSSTKRRARFEYGVDINRFTKEILFRDSKPCRRDILHRFPGRAIIINQSTSLVGRLESDAKVAY